MQLTCQWLCPKLLRSSIAWFHKQVLFSGQHFLTITLETPTVYQGVHANDRSQMSPWWYKRPTRDAISQAFKEIIDYSLGTNGKLDDGPSAQQDVPERRRHRNTEPDCAPGPEQQISSNTNAPSSNRDTAPPSSAPYKLKRFQKAASAHEMRRYSDLKDRLESPLLKYVYKYKGEGQSSLSPIALRPVMLGTTLNDAKLWMVVFCDKSLEGRATKFLKQQWVCELCNLSGHNQTNIEILVAGSVWPVSKILAQLPLSPDKNRNNDWTFCGVPMCFFDAESHSIRMGTLGGPLHVSFNDGSSMLMGMTSGHVMQDFGGTGSNGPGVDNEESASDLESEPGLSDRPHIHGGMTNTSQVSLDFEQFKPADQIRASLWESSSAMLPIVASKNTEVDTKKNYDWTLVKLNDMPLPNQQSRPTGDEKPLQLPTMTVLERTEEVPVILLSSEGRKPGYLCTMPARLQMHPGDSFVDTHLIRLREDYCESVS